MSQGTFRARLIGVREEKKDDGRSMGEADILVAVFGEPDTNVAFGNEVRQIIDQGAFREWIDGADFSADPVPLYLDHGDAHITGFTTAAKKLGYADNFRETADGLVLTAHYNLDKQLAREAYSDLVFDPRGTQFSFRWPPDEEIEERDDGFEHVTKFTKVVEASQVAFGAQEKTGVLATAGVRAADLRSAIRPHSTNTSTDDWNEDTVLEQFGEIKDDQTLQRMFAWANADEDILRFPHHVVEGNDVGAASVTACKNGIEYLNAGRLGEDMPDVDRKGVYAHLAAHLADAEEEVPELRATPTDVAEWLTEDDEFRKAVHGLLPEEQETEETDEARTTEESEPVETSITYTEEETEALVASGEEHFHSRQVDRTSWDGNAAMSACSDASCYRAICAGRKSGDPGQRGSWALPHHKSAGAPPNASGVSAALGRLGQTQGLTNKDAAKAHLEAHQRSIQSERSIAEDPEGLREFLSSVDFLKVLQHDTELASIVASQAEEAQMPDPLVSFYRTLNATRAKEISKPLD